MAYNFKNLIFEGGGVKGIAYVGALNELRKLDILDKIDRVGGTSAGAINALLVGLNFSERETQDILWNLNFNNFLDDSWLKIKEVDRLINEFGWYKGDFFRKWISDIIKIKTGNSESTFADINYLRSKIGFKDLYFVGTNLSTRCTEIFSNEHTPRFCVADAIRISMSIPLFFKAIRSVRNDVYVDGGVLLNYPIKLFDREKYVVKGEGVNTSYYEKENKELTKLDHNISKYIFNNQTLGFRLDTKEEISVFRDHAVPQHHKIEDLFDYAWGFIETIMEAQQSSHLHSDDWQRTIYIDTLGVKTTDFDLPDAKKNELVKSGSEGVKKYFEWFDNK